MMALQTQLDTLELKVNQLITLLATVSAENTALRERQQWLEQECERLQQKNHSASEQLESILALLHQQIRTQSETKEEA